MPDEPIRLRPIEEADLEILRRFDTDPSSRALPVVRLPQPAYPPTPLGGGWLARP